MKLLTLILVPLFYINITNAQNVEQTAVQNNILYNFSPELIDAAAMCAEYSEDFSQNNTQFTSPIFVNVIGIEGENCHFMIENHLKENEITKYDCLVDPQQMADIVNAMQNRSLDNVSSTYNKDGKDISVTGTLFDVTIEKISNISCSKSIIEQDDEEEKKEEVFVANIDNFSTDFMNALYKCNSYIEEKEILGVYERIEIVGMKNDKCHLRYDDFDLFLPNGLLSNIQSFSDVQMLLKNKNISSYVPSYDYKGILFGVSQCTKDNPSSTIALQNNTKKEVSIHKGMVFKYENDGCRIRLLNQVYVAGILDDYSINCFVEQKDLKLILEVYGELLLKNNEEYTDEMKNADDELMYRLQQADLCKKVNTK